MDLRAPLRSLCPGTHGRVLTALAEADRPLVRELSPYLVTARVSHVMTLTNTSAYEEAGPPDPDCDAARRLLDNVRRNRRTQSASDLADAARALGCEIDTSRGKGSHWFAKNGPGPHFPIPTS